MISEKDVTILNSRPLQLVLVYFPIAFLYWLFSLIGIKIPLPRQLRNFRDSKVMFDIGGITFAERGPVLLYNIFSLMPALLMDVPIIKLSQAVGPFNSPINRFFARIFLKRCKFVFTRGEKSAEFLKGLEVISADSTQSAADIAFLYQPEYSLSDENEEKVDQVAEKLSNLKASGKKIVFIFPSSVIYKKAKNSSYERLILSAIERIDQPENVYVFAPNSNRAESNKTQNNDIYVIQKFRDYAESHLSSGLRERMEWIDSGI